MNLSRSPLRVGASRTTRLSLLLLFAVLAVQISRSEGVETCPDPSVSRVTYPVVCDSRRRSVDKEAEHVEPGPPNCRVGPGTLACVDRAVLKTQQQRTGGLFVGGAAQSQAQQPQAQQPQAQQPQAQQPQAQQPQAQQPQAQQPQAQQPQAQQPQAQQPQGPQWQGQQAQAQQPQAQQPQGPQWQGQQAQQSRGPQWQGPTPQASQLLVQQAQGAPWQGLQSQGAQMQVVQGPPSPPGSQWQVQSPRPQGSQNLVFPEGQAISAPMVSEVWS